MDDLRRPFRARPPQPRTGRGRTLACLLLVSAAVAGTGGCGATATTAAPSSPSLASTPSSPSVPSSASAKATSASPSATASAGASSGQALPAPGAPLPTDPARLATALRDTTTALNAAIDRWRPSTGAPPRDVELLALYQQRLYRHAARHRALADRAFARLPAALAAQAKDNVSALRGLLALTRPIKPSAVFKVQAARPAAELLGHFKRAERRFGVEWEVLASVMFVETKFGRVRADSHAGAQGPMQFMPATWRAYGMGGDVQNPRDAVMGAANYLHASGAPRDYRRALHAYNPSQAYVDAVLLHARQMRRDPRAYYAYYNWQVFVLTTAGERRLTGPK
ncbi:lytic murein transglycosylase [Nonomuraea sp. NPDC049758]|uniref:lytic transglycosylase domain-containing protein n=1 Tax=Nonomuraea sp. NPDC049758 TaxID=3154360 RepID=UPI00341B8972